MCNLLYLPFDKRTSQQKRNWFISRKLKLTAVGANALAEDRTDNKIDILTNIIISPQYVLLNCAVATSEYGYKEVIRDAAVIILHSLLGGRLK